jgi:hypothetical protein
MRKLSSILLCLSILFFISCSNSKVRTTNFSSQYNVDPNSSDKEVKLSDLKESISKVRIKNINYYYSNKDSFFKDNGYIYYLNPYVVEETGIGTGLNINFFAKVITDKENFFNKITFYDEKGNKLVLEFKDIKRNYLEDSFFIEESSHLTLSNKDIKTLEKFLDSKDLFVIFDGKEKYQYKLTHPVKHAMLDVIRQYKTMQ